MLWMPLIFTSPLNLFARRNPMRRFPIALALSFIFACASSGGTPSSNPDHTGESSYTPPAYPGQKSGGTQVQTRSRSSSNGAASLSPKTWECKNDPRLPNGAKVREDPNTGICSVTFAQAGLNNWLTVVPMGGDRVKVHIYLTVQKTSEVLIDATCYGEASKVALTCDIESDLLDRKV